MLRSTKIMLSLLLATAGALPTMAQTVVPADSIVAPLLNDTVIPLPVDSILLPALSDTLATDMPAWLPTVSLPADSAAILPAPLTTDTLPTVNKSGLEAPVTMTATDSIVFLPGENKGFLYGSAHVTYQTIDLKAENVTMQTDSNIVSATFGLDTLQQPYGFPVFADGSQTIEAKMMRYNFKSKKGFVNDAITEQGEGYLNATQAKRNADGSFFITDGKYTTCDDHEHPHFYLDLTKAKVRPQKDVITGPAYLVIEDLPIKFIGIPFAFFPFSSTYSSGIIMPSYADEMNRGFGLRNGGYYFAINDYVDLSLTGEIYTKGSWGLTAASNYIKRYKFSGNFNISYLYTKTGDGEEDPDYSVSKGLNISWTHRQDSKANMYRTFTAGVSFRTSSYDHNQLNNAYNPIDASSSSNVTVSQRFPNSPWNLSASMRIDQNKRDSTVALTLPNLTLSMSRVYPFKRKIAAGSEKWYEKISLSYSGDFRNNVKTKEDRMLQTSFRSDWQKGMKHSIPVSATFNVFDVINITPSFNYNERWYFRGVNQRWDDVSQRSVASDTNYNFKRLYDFNFSVSMQTKLYGFYEPLFNIFGLKRIRHVFTPSISLGYQPDFSSDFFGFYNTYHYIDSYGDVQTYTYSPYSQEMFGAPASGKSGSVSFNFQNNVEAKVKNSQDSLVTKSLIDNLGISFSYNMMAKEFKWSNINMNLRLKLSQTLTVNLNGVFDPYTYDVIKGRPQRVNVMRWERPWGKGFGIGRLQSTGYSISPSINQDTFKKWFGKKDDKKDKKEDTEEETGDSPVEQQQHTSLLAKKADDNEYDSDGYMKSNIRWNLSANFSMNYGYGDFNYDKKEYDGRFTYSFSLNGSFQPTRSWNFSFNTTYDFVQKKFAYINCNMSRSLHCWSLTASFIPIGTYRSYFVTLGVNSSMLQDLKYDHRNRNAGYDVKWYD